MFDEWIHVLPPRDFRTDRRARALVRRPSSELTSKLDPTESSSSSCPSLITFSRSVPPWLSLGQDYYVSSHHVHSATIKDIQSAGDLTVWINVLDPLDGRQIIAHDKSSDIDVVYLEDQNPLHLVPRVSYQLSDVIVMIGENLEDAADQHLLWLQSCKAVSGNPAIKPYAFIVVRDIQDERTLQEDFIQACLMSRKAQDFDRRGLEELSGSLFEHCRCLSSEDNLEKEIITAVRIGRRLREARKCLWSQKTFFELRTYLTWALASKPLEPLNIVKALSMVNPVGEASGTLWPELASILEVPGRDNDELLEKFFIPVMGSCFARNVLKCDHVFRAAEVFNVIYKQPLEMFVSQNEVHLGQIQANMEICISDYEKRPNYYHFQKMRKFKRYWAGIFSRGLCLGCLLCCCQIFLPCGHALCETCYRNSTSTETVHGNLLTTNGSLRCHACPLCWKEFPNFKVTLSPPTASGRILSLDGGGVLGLVTMKLLERLFKEIELDLSFHELFDGIWGSSVGGIIAILLGKKKWTLEECMKKFPVFAAALFNTPNSWLESFGNWTATWRKVFNYARKDCFYDERQAEEGFRQAIGVDTLMLGMVDNEFTPKVGVTTTRSLIGSEIITSYNHFHKSLIPWTQRDNQCPDLQAWEAARCTSAAPCYLSKKQVASMPGESFEDGGLKHNYPGRVALAEAKSLFPRHAAPIFLAAGCGKYANDDRKKKESWFVGSGLDRLHRYHMESLDANHQFEQHHGESTNLNRLNLSMAMERPALDQVEALPQICRQVDFIIASDSQLHETQIRPTAFLWTASMLCFEFVKRPTWCGNGLHCVGYIFCRYPNRQKLTEQLRERFGEDGGFVIGDEGFDFEIPREIVFTLPSLNEEFSIRLHCHDQEAPISGFPSTAGEILALQTDWHRGQAKSNKKRNLEENADCRPLKKMRY